MYNRFSTIYENEMQDFDYESYMEMIMQKLKISGDIIEFGCGTGSISKLILPVSKKLTLVDFSSDMLSLARKKLPSKQGVEYIESNISNFDTNFKYDYAFSCIDVVNYITDEEELLRSLKNIYRILKSDGIYVFDSKTYDFAEKELDNKTFFMEREAYDLVWNNDLNGDLLEMEIIMYIKNHGFYEKEVEIHKLKLWSEDYLMELLYRIGFKKVEVTPYYGRNIFIVRR